MFALTQFANDQRGATAIEYGLILALIAIAIIGGMNSFAGGAIGLITFASDTLDAAM